MNVDRFSLSLPVCESVDPRVERVGDVVVVGYVADDDDPPNPRDWDNAGTMATWHNRYTLGDEQPKVTPHEQRFALACEHDPDLEAWAERLSDDVNWNEFTAAEHDAYTARIDADINARVDAVLGEHYVELPLYLYDHSGITMNTVGFGDPWDSGQVGFIYAKRGTDGLTDEQLGERLKAEVDTYDQYLRGESYVVVTETFDAHTGQPVSVPPGSDTLIMSGGYLGVDDAREGLDSEVTGATQFVARHQSDSAQPEPNRR